MDSIKSYLNHLILEGKSENTIETYYYHLKNFYRWFNTTEKAINELKPSDLLNFREELSLDGKKARSINAITSCVRGFFEYLIIKEKVKNNPVSKALTIQVNADIVNPLTDEQLLQLASHISDWKENIRAAFHCMIATGARVGEVSKLKKGDFRLINGQLWINITDAKWGSDRQIPLILKESAVIVYQYIQMIDAYNTPAFRVSKRTLQTYADKFQNDTGIPFHCHIIRHTFATRLLEAEVNIEKIRFMLGHKTNNMTRHYTQTANINVKDLAPTIWQKEKIK